MDDSNTTQSILEVFLLLSNFSVDYQSTHYFDDSLLLFNWVFTVFAVIGSSMCVILNSFLLYCIFTVEEFKNLYFFPIGLQAGIDIIGPGISNIIYTCIYRLKLEDTVVDFRPFGNYNSDAGTSVDRLLGAFLAMDSKLNCLLTFFRSILNQYATGMCILTSAFIRYCLVCHPTKNYLETKRLKLYCLALVIIISVTVVANVVDMYFNNRQIHTFVENDAYYETFAEGELVVDGFFESCSVFVLRSNQNKSILLWDVLASLVIPALLSAFFYIKICTALLKRERDQERNRNLTIAFFLNWLLWVIFWSVYYFLTSLSLGQKNSNKSASDRTFLDNLEGKILTVKENFIFFYSHLNPLFFIVILKPFQDKLKNLITLGLRSHEDGFGIKDKNSNKKVHMLSNIFRPVWENFLNYRLL